MTSHGITKDFVVENGILTLAISQAVMWHVCALILKNEIEKGVEIMLTHIHTQMS